MMKDEIVEEVRKVRQNQRIPKLSVRFGGAPGFNRPKSRLEAADASAEAAYNGALRMRLHCQPVDAPANRRHQGTELDLERTRASSDQIITEGNKGNEAPTTGLAFFVTFVCFC